MTERLTIKKILKKTTDYFKEHGIETARLDAEVLLADLLDMERIKLYVNFDRPLTEVEINQYRQRVIQRAKRMPVAYIIGYQEFMSLKFKVNEDVLIPRPETEHLVEAVIQRVNKLADKREKLTVIDLCTGSGAIIISLAKELADVPLEINYIGTDVSQEALAVAKDNAKLHQVQNQIQFLVGDLLNPVKELNLKPDIIISNPPYIADKELQELEPELQYEPEIALKAGENGIDFYRQIISETEQLLTDGGIIGFEVGNQQSKSVYQLLEENNFINLTVIDDYAEVPRVILGEKALDGRKGSRFNGSN
ncbi:peptide chain release factor N(5)-glutamine methyltransferase [Acetohalobium arabaticum]|uniref:Release factor glutamine methyltransferase n=1 Tax=Acetohalobium arabaticum (strain ATCC 49924 / DSM 5501 / Z-7288) TaxID=574087 RepID=D9QTZ9_ACEAZ|nr:peptide chain release factor N(5)-glutamine methyltransferase [Acetohalobium arabaticum]ADL13720.1 protein-(glutamine-N5) methyltransferase, release factor-specific [Acetohalobium arabaticum DSM 5501]